MSEREQKQKADRELQQRLYRFEELGEAWGTEELEQLADGSLRDRLALERRRLEELGLTVETRLWTGGGADCTDGSGYRILDGDRQVDLLRETYHREYLRRRRYRRDGKRAGTFSEGAELYGTMARWGGEGDWRFTEYRWEEQMHSQVKRRRQNRRQLLVLLILTVIAGLLTSLNEGWDGFVFGCGFFGSLMFIVYIAVWLLGLYIDVVAGLRWGSYYRRCFAPGAHLVDRMQLIDPMLEADYVAAVALELGCRRVFESRDFGQVVDLLYRGALTLLSVKDRPEGTEVSLELRVRTILDQGPGKKLKRKKQRLRVGLQHSGPMTVEESYTRDKFDRWQLMSVELLDE